jgi:hypothetical protein
MKGNAYVPFMLRRGDGSTLSLDFTAMGDTLDSRFTFTRSTNATFINSQGYVEWANSNMYWNTAFEGLSGSNPSLTSSGWGYALSTGGTAVFNGDGTVTVTTTAAERRAIFRSSGFSGGGLRVVASVDVTIASGSLQASQVIVTGTPTNAQHYVNGVIWNSSHPIWNGGILPVGTQFNIAYATDSVTSGTTSMYFGVGCTSVSAGSATFSNPRWTMWKGSATVPYYPNTSATNNSTTNYFKSNDYQAPRFDYDPTTLTLRGLLIEGTASNLLNWSESFASSGGTNNNWTDTSISRTTGQTDPANGTTAIRFTASAGNATVISSAAIGTSAQRTFSIWLRRVTGTGNIQFTTDNGTTWTTQAITSSWVRYTFPATTSAQRVGIRIVTSADAIEMWGAMLEDGSSSSSYIPTGASQVQRTADTCIAASTGFSSWFTGGTSGTFYADWFGGVRGITSTVRTVLSTSDVTGRHLHLQQTAAAGNLKVADFGAANSVTTSNSITSGARTKGAFSFSGSTVNLTLNGGTVATSSSIAFSTAPTYLVLGGTSTNGSTITDATVLLNGSIRAIKYWPSVLPTATLQSLTT